MAMTAQKWSINGAAVELGVDRRALAKKAASIEPVGKEGRANLYFLADLARVLYASETEGLKLDQERARLAKAQADRTELEVKEKRGILVDVSLIAEQWDRVGSNIKTRMLAIPTKAAPLVMGMKSMPKVQAVLEKVIHDALEQLAGTAPGIIAEPVPAGRPKAAAKAKRKRVVRQASKTKSRGKRRAG